MVDQLLKTAWSGLSLGNLFLNHMPPTASGTNAVLHILPSIPNGNKKDAATDQGIYKVQIDVYTDSSSMAPIVPTVLNWSPSGVRIIKISYQGNWSDETQRARHIFDIDLRELG